MVFDEPMSTTHDPHPKRLVGRAGWGRFLVYGTDRG